MAITVVIGAPCSGKSTWAHEQLKNNDVVIDYDELAKALGSKIAHKSEGSIRNIALHIRKEAINKIIAGINDDAYIIHTNPTDEFVNKYLKSKAKFVLLNPGKEVCLQRAEERPEGTIEAIEKWFLNPPSVIDELELQPIQKHNESKEQIEILNFLKQKELLEILNFKLKAKS